MLPKSEPGERPGAIGYRSPPGRNGSSKFIMHTSGWVNTSKDLVPYGAGRRLGWFAETGQKELGQPGRGMMAADSAEENSRQVMMHQLEKHMRWVCPFNDAADSMGGPAAALKVLML